MHVESVDSRLHGAFHIGQHVIDEQASPGIQPAFRNQGPVDGRFGLDFMMKARDRGPIKKLEEIRELFPKSKISIFRVIAQQPEPFSRSPAPPYHSTSNLYNWPCFIAFFGNSNSQFPLPND